MRLEHKPHDFSCRLRWTGRKAGPTANYRSYSRALEVDIPGKPTLAMSSAPAFLGEGSVHNPEDMLMAALSTCHCLSYLALAARNGVLVADYTDEATGVMEWDGTTYHFTKVVLRPVVTVQKGTDLTRARELHHRAHEECFIARSVNFEVKNEPTIIEASE
jgi:peroxiredoxin-like protein